MPAAITYLFVPASRPERFAKALATAADVVILDLEDAVTPSDKDGARDHVRSFVATQPALATRLAVRINDAATPWFAADLALLREGGVALAMLPKADAAAAIAAVIAALPPGGRVLPIVESAEGLAQVDAVARAPGVERIAFGTLDFAVDLGMSGDERGLVAPSTAIAVASRRAGLLPPIAGVTVAIDDDAQLLADLAFARAFGFAAKLCIHPRQVGVVRQAFMPSADEVAWARKVVAAAEGAPGAFTLDGRMIDRPVLRKAQDILDRADP